MRTSACSEDVDRQVGKVLYRFAKDGSGRQYRGRLHERSRRGLGLAPLGREDEFLRRGGGGPLDRSVGRVLRRRDDSTGPPRLDLRRSADDLRLRRGTAAAHDARREPAGGHRNTGAAGPRAVVSEMASALGRSFMVRTERHKYMVFPDPGGRKCWSTLSPTREMLNLAESASTAELDRHRRLFAQWRKTTEEGKYPMRTPEPASRGRRNRYGTLPSSRQWLPFIWLKPSLRGQGASLRTGDPVMPAGRIHRRLNVVPDLGIVGEIGGQAQPESSPVD